MDAQEFRKDFLENVKAEAAATGEGSCAAFVGAISKFIILALSSINNKTKFLFTRIYGLEH